MERHEARSYNIMVLKNELIKLKNFVELPSSKYEFCVLLRFEFRLFFRGRPRPRFTRKTLLSSLIVAGSFNLRGRPRFRLTSGIGGINWGPDCFNKLKDADEWGRLSMVLSTSTKSLSGELARLVWNTKCKKRINSACIHHSSKLTYVSLIVVVICPGVVHFGFNFNALLY